MRDRGKAVAVVLAGLLPLGSLGMAGAAFLVPPAPGPPPAWMVVAPLAAVPLDGTPRRFPVRADRTDAWTYHPGDRTLGRVFLRRRPESGEVIALRADHHRYRIGVRYDAGEGLFRSECWHVRFDLDGREVAGEGRTPLGEDLQRLPVRLAGGQVLVGWDRPPAGGP
jgi:hypothetical protein